MMINRIMKINNCVVFQNHVLKKKSNIDLCFLTIHVVKNQMSFILPMKKVLGVIKIIQGIVYHQTKNESQHKKKQLKSNYSLFFFLK